MEQKVKRRKTRSDKLVTIKPTITTSLKQRLYRLAFITKIPVKDVAKELCLHSLTNDQIIRKLSRYFKNDIRLNNHLYEGNVNTPNITKRTPTGTSERFTFRVTQRTHKMIVTLAFAMDCSVARASALLVEESLNDFEFIDDFLNDYLKSRIDSKQFELLITLKKELNLEYEEYFGEKVTFAPLLSHIVNEVREPDMTLEEAINHFLSQWNLIQLFKE